MPHLLLDLAKSPTPKRKIPFAHAKVGLFATFKAAKRMITPEEPHSIYVLPRKKAALSIAQAAADILQHQPQAAIAIVSPRKKLRLFLYSLQIKYPQAQLLHKKKLGKSVRQFLQQHGQPCSSDLGIKGYAEAQGARQNNQPSRTPSKTPSEQQLIEHAAHSVQQAVAQIAPAAPAHQVFTLLASQDTAPSLISTALALLKKNHPKKKQDLLRLLTERSNPKLAQEMLVALQSAGKIHIDAAENVRYR